MILRLTTSLLLLTTATQLLPELGYLFELVGAAPRRRALVCAPPLSCFFTPTSRCLSGFIFHARGVVHVVVTRPLAGKVGAGDGTQG